MGSNGPRSPDPRREPDDDEADLPTDIMSRESVGLAPARPKLRLEAASSLPSLVDAGPDESTLIVRPSRSGVTAAVLPRTVRAWLEVRGGPALAEESFELTMVKTLIGRGHHADVRIKDGRLSRKHVTIFFTGPEFRIRDEGSGNGTMLNGSRVVEYCVRDGDEIVAGSSIFVFHAEIVPE